ncbi:hypothetical protein N9748_00385 [bacterium]|jgi:hypothetical protein|nr:hypothetical protein [bacterium]
MVKQSFRNRCLKLLFVTLYLACAIVAPRDHVQAQEAGYVAGFESLPLMPGLTELINERVNFDTPAGRIVEAKTQGDIKAQTVEMFYAKTLPQLGWQKIGPLKFERDGERLSIEISTVSRTGENLIVRFAIRPVSPSGAKP